MPLISCDGSCPAAKALRDEVQHLRAQNGDLLTKLTAMADPLLGARVAMAQRRQAAPERHEAPRTRSHSPATLRRQHADRQDDAPREPQPTNDEVHASFEG